MAPSIVAFDPGGIDRGIGRLYVHICIYIRIAVRSMARETRFEWDAGKAIANKRKHGIRFESALLVFDDALGKTEIEGTEHGELRWRTTGLAHDRLIVVVHTRIEDNDIEIIRIISARRATRREYRDFEENP